LPFGLYFFSGYSKGVSNNIEVVLRSSKLAFAAKMKILNNFIGKVTKQKKVRSN